MNAPRLRIGLTGGIGSGKSTVAALLARRGATVVDTDLIARQLTLPGGAAIGAIAAAFGAGFIDASGALDRERLRNRVFSEPAARRRLETILHPLIGIETERQACAAVGPAVVFDVPLLVESGRWRARVDKVLVVDCREATQIERVVARSGWTPQAVRAVIDQQASRDRRRACADAVIYNDGVTAQALVDEVASLWRRWLRRADRDLGR
ncbi:MAG: dephospho-CoA kinase [Burkholderiales bacterium]|nr:dephospho-CoA kinase [Burkholderiales bacterium]MDE2625630.1 dephospho-CoA kinase [Burkholderiales bacterium]